VAKLRNVSPLGDLEVPLLGRVVKAGEVFEVPADVAALLGAQPRNWASVKLEKGVRDDDAA